MKKKNYEEVFKIMWLLIIGSVFGYIVETLYCSYLQHTFADRSGTFYLYISPIYGLGFVLAYFMLRHDFDHKATDRLNIIRKSTGKMKEVLRFCIDNLYLFFISGVFGGLFEVVLSYLQELFFNYRSWNYDGFLSIDGRTNFKMMVIWGVIGILFVRVIYPLFENALRLIPTNVGNVFCVVIFTAVLFDVLVTSYGTYRYKLRREGDAASNAIESFFDKTYPDSYVKDFLGAD